MKFYQNVPREEGGKLPDINSAFITFGKCLIRPYEIVRHSDGTVEDCPLMPDGTYLRIVTPFTANKTVTNPYTFEPYTGPCRYAWLIRYRKLRFSGIRKIYRFSVWVPVNNFVEAQSELRYDDAYLHAVNIKDKL